MNDEQNGVATLEPTETTMPAPAESAEEAPAEAPPTATTAPGATDDWQAKVREAAAYARREEAAYEELKAEAAQLKKSWEAAVERLMRLIERTEADEPLFDAMEPDAIPTVESGQDDSWKAVPLTAALADLPIGILKSLEAAQLTTVGELADFTATGNLLTDIPGIGAAKAKKVEAALEVFWKKRNKFAADATASILSFDQEAQPYV